jgi:hypothetical protein
MSYQTIINKMTAFSDAHLQVKKFGSDFKEQMPNFATKDEKYPIVYAVPTSTSAGLNTRQFNFDVYCLDIIQKDRQNINVILSDTELILNDFYLYFYDGQDLSIDVISPMNTTPLNNFDLDYCAGWVMTITFEVANLPECVIPIETPN